MEKVEVEEVVDSSARRQEARRQCELIRRDILSRPQTLEADCMTNGVTRQELIAAMDHILTDWSEGGVTHPDSGPFNLCDAVLHLRRLLPVKIQMAWRQTKSNPNARRMAAAKLMQYTLDRLNDPAEYRREPEEPLF